MQSYGVVLFFALSGFLIAYNCMTKKSYSFFEYMADRFARIFTAFLPALVLIALIDPAWQKLGEPAPVANFVHQDNSLSAFLANALMLQHTPFGRMIEGLPRWEPFGSGRQFWTIAVEWWLYSLFGIIFFAFRSSIRERLLMAVLFLPAALCVLFFCTQDSIGLVWVAAALAAIGFVSFDGGSRVKGLALPATLFFAFALWQRFEFLAPGLPFNFYDANFMLLTTALLFSFVLLIGEVTPLAAVLVSSAPLWRWLSSISYSLYLTHQTLHYAWDVFIGISSWTSLLLLCVLSLVVAWLFTFAFDRHHKDVAAWIKAKIASPERHAVSES